MTTVKAIPDGYPTLTPYLIVSNAVEAIEFYKKAFGAHEKFRMGKPDGKIAHAELQMGSSPFMLADECAEMDMLSPKTVGRAGALLHVYVENVDAMVEAAIAAGATLIMPVSDQFYGDRAGSVVDPYGHIWHIATHKEDLTSEEIEERMQKQMCDKR